MSSQGIMIGWNQDFSIEEANEYAKKGEGAQVRFYKTTSVPLFSPQIQRVNF